MRCLATIFFLALVVTTASWAQSVGQPRHPDNPNATFVGQFSAHLVNSSVSQNHPSVFTDASAGASFTVTVFNIGIRTDYYIDPNTITFDGDGAWVDQHSTADLFELVSKMALSQGLELGYAACESNCGLVNATTRVYAPACVTRTGTGTDTRFKPCSLSSYSLREYVVCCPNGIAAPIADLIFKLNGGLCLGDDCEATCP